MSEQQKRFETIYRKQLPAGDLIKNGDGHYAIRYAQHRWEGWQAALAAQAQEVPQLTGEYPPISQKDFDSDSDLWTYLDAWRNATPGEESGEKAEWACKHIHRLMRAYVDVDRSAQEAPSEPVAKHWIVHRLAKGAPIWPDYAKPAGFFNLKSAESWMAEQINFNGWRDAWIEPLYDRPAPASAQAAAPGWVIVERCRLMRAADILERDGDEYGIGHDLRAMLAAAPSTQQGEGV